MENETWSEVPLEDEEETWEEVPANNSTGTEGVLAPTGGSDPRPDRKAPVDDSPSWYDRFKGATVGAAQGFMGDTGDEAAGYARAYATLSPEKADGYIDEVRKEDARLRNETPGTYYPGYVVGSALSPINKVTKWAKGDGLIKGAMKAGSAGSVYGVGGSDAEGTDKLWDGLKGGAMGAGFDLGLRAVPAMYRRGVAGVRKDTHNYYTNNMDAVDKADFGSLYDDAAKFGDEAQETYSKSKLAYKGIKENISNDLRLDHDKARGAFDSARNDLKQSLSAVDVPEETIEKLPEAIRNLMRRNSEDSGKAFELLERSGVDIDLGPLRGELIKSVKAMRGLNGQIPPGLEKDAALLRKWAAYMKGSSNVSAAKVKKLVQDLDASSENIWASLGAGQKPSKGQREIISFRSKVNDEVLKVPGYDEVMEPLRHQTKLSKALQGVFSDPYQARLRLRQIAEGRRPEDAKALGQLGEIFGQDYLGTLAPYRNARETLKGNKFNAALSDLPESAALRKAEDARRAINMDKVYEGTPEAAMLRTAEDAARSVNINKALAATPEAKKLAQTQVISKDLQPFKTETAETNLRRLYTKQHDPNRNINLNKQLGKLEDYSGENFTKRVKDVAVSEAINKPFVQGGRNVYGASLSMSGLLGGAAEAMGSANAGAVGKLAGGAGAVIGMMNDVVGPQFYRAMTRARYHPRYSKWMETLENAATRGAPQAFLTHKLLMKKDPEYRELIESEEQQP